MTDVTILDGGLATELEARGHDLSDRLWSARVLLDDPAAIEGVHLAYFEAGADVATTASYQATVPGLVAAGLDRAAALGVVRRSVELARRARDRHAASIASHERPTERLVAGSVGPYGAMLADGSEYRGDYDPGAAALREVHAPRIEALLEAGVDLLAIETIPTIREAEVLVELVAETGARAWLSFQCRDGDATAAGEPIRTALAVADGARGIVAVGVNCTAPRHVPSLLAALAGDAASDAAPRGATARIAYPNGGDTWDAAARDWVSADRKGAWDAATVATWTRFGATWLGGCCGTGPAQTAALARAVGRA